MLSTPWLAAKAIDKNIMIYAASYLNKATVMYLVASSCFLFTTKTANQY
ncbi:hypothetical protein ACGP04_15405 [Piscirickettsia salmonis]